MSFLKVKLIGSGIGRSQRQKDTLRGLGLRRRHQLRVLKDTPSIRGLINKVRDLVVVEPSSEGELPKREPVKTYNLLSQK